VLAFVCFRLVDAQALGTGRVVWISTAKYPINTIGLIIGTKKGGNAPKTPVSRTAFFEAAQNPTLSLSWHSFFNLILHNSSYFPSVVL